MSFHFLKNSDQGKPRDLILKDWNDVQRRPVPIISLEAADGQCFSLRRLNAHCDVNRWCMKEDRAVSSDVAATYRKVNFSSNN